MIKTPFGAVTRIDGPPVWAPRWFLRLVGFLTWLVLYAYARLTFRKKITICAPDGTQYLSRWFLWEGSYLHKFHQSDPDRGWHCHPWYECESLILRGWYSQEIPEFYRVRGYTTVLAWWVEAEGTPYYSEFGPMDRNYLTDKDFHAVALITPVVWTWFRYGRRHDRSWGFATTPDDFKLAKPTDGVCPGHAPWSRLEKEHGGMT